MIEKFQQLVRQVTDKVDINTIFKQALGKYIIRSYNITKINVRQGFKLYKQIFEKQNRHLGSGRIRRLPNQKRIYLWFCLIYERAIQRQIKNFLQEDWKILADFFPGKQPDFLEYLAKNIMSYPKKSIIWTAQEDRHLISCIQQCIYQSRQCGLGKWNQIAKKMFLSSNKAILKKPKQCRQRWYNHLDSMKTKGDWNEAEDQIIVNYVEKNGQKWSKIVKLLGCQRTQHMIKNRYFSLLRKQNKQKKQTQSLSQANQLSQEIISKREIKYQSVNSQQSSQVIECEMPIPENRNLQNLNNQNQFHSTLQQHYDANFINPMLNPYFSNFFYWNYLGQNIPSFYPVNFHNANNYDQINSINNIKNESIELPQSK